MLRGGKLWESDTKSHHRSLRTNQVIVDSTVGKLRRGWCTGAFLMSQKAANIVDSGVHSAIGDAFLQTTRQQPWLRKYERT